MKNSLGKFTVIIPVYNSELTIRKVINHLLPLTEFGINIIISDNCSTDNTKDILNEFTNLKNIKILFQKKNTGPENIMILLKLVKTEWVLTIGSDDYLINAVDLVSEFNNFLKFKNYIGMSFKSYFIYENSLVEDSSNITLSGNKFMRFFLFYLFPGCNSRFYGIIKKDLMLKHCPVGYFGDDVVMSANILENGNWFCNKKIILHREKGISSNPTSFRKAYGLKGINSIFTPIKFLKYLLKLDSSRNIIIKFMIFLLYFRYAVSPLKHLFLKK